MNEIRELTEMEVEAVSGGDGFLNIGLALQLPFLKISESMGNHDSKIVGAGRVG